MSEDKAVPDLYDLAFMPGQFRCPKCGFQLSKQTLSVAHGAIGTTPENRESEPCPNDGTMMVHVTYREQLEAYAERLKEEFDRRDTLLDASENLLGWLREFYPDEPLFSKDPDRANLTITWLDKAIRKARG
jgi:hypothetical protein